MKIIDVSEFQKDIDWSAVAETGYPAIIRMGLRGSVKANAQYYGKLRYDDYFKKNLAGVKKYNITYSVYFFPTAINEEEAKEEANWILKQLSDLNIKLSMPLWLDTEPTDSGKGRADNLSKATRTKLLKTITDILRKHHIPCGIYSYRNWLNNNVDMSAFQQDVINNTWVAENPKLSYKGKACLWQYGKEKISGINGPCDVSQTLTQFDLSVSENVKEEPKEEVKEKKVGRFRDVVVNKAKEFLGTKSGTANHKKILNAYNGHKPLARGVVMSSSMPWCATFVSAVAIMCGYTDIIPTECSCGFMVDLAKKKGIWQEKDDYIPKPGDILMYDWDDNKTGAGDDTGWPDHTGFVETVTGTSFTTIEGNAGNSEVKRQNVKINQKNIRGFICPKYTAMSAGNDASNSSATINKTALTIALPDIHLGDKGEHVRLWQFLINIEKQDGFFGPKSEKDTMKWQEANGKTVDGWVGKGCWTKAMKNKGWM